MQTSGVKSFSSYNVYVALRMINDSDHTHVTHGITYYAVGQRANVGHVGVARWGQRSSDDADWQPCRQAGLT